MTLRNAASAAAETIPGSAGDTPVGRLTAQPPICLVGPGWRFTSGMSYYTCRLATAMAGRHHVSVIQLRHLLPRRFYPGRQRVGQSRARMTYPPHVPVYDGIDWWWGLSVLRALAFLRARRPAVLVFQWWTAAALHTYLLLAVAGRVLRARVVMEIHESQDPGEADLRLVHGYGRWGLRLLLRLCQGCVLHSEADRRMLQNVGIQLDMPVSIAPHGPYDQYRAVIPTDPPADAAIAKVRQAPRTAVVNLLFFGVIRPYKGLEDLLTVFNALSQEEAAGFWLTVVGETWGGWTGADRLIETSPHRDRITFVNDYVPDEVAAAAFGHADVVVLPYHRSSSSGPLHVAMSWGLPVVVTDVGGLRESARGYGGAVFVPPRDLAGLKAGILQAAAMAGKQFKDPGDWAQTVEAILAAADVSGPAGEGSHGRNCSCGCR